MHNFRKLDIWIDGVDLADRVYAITDSLCDLPNIDRVQILVDGVVPDILESSYELKTDIVITIEPSHKTGL